MSILGTIKSWFGVAVNKFKETVAKLFSLAKPFLKAVLSEAASAAWATSSHLFIEAVQYVATQGLPTDKSKQDAFYEYMRKNGNEAIKDLKEKEINFLRELALQVYDKAKS